MDVAPHGGAILEEVLCLSPVEWAGGLEHPLKVLRACTMPTGLRSSSVIGRDHHLPMVLSILIPLVIATLGQGMVVAAISTTEVVGGLDLAADVGLDSLLTGGILGGDI